MTVRVKICGLTRPADARAAVVAGADLLGLNFWPGSKRCVDLERARELAAAARAAGPVAVVGVFVNADPAEVASVRSKVLLDYVQLHGDEPPEHCAALGGRVIKAFAPTAASELPKLAAYRCDMVLLDALCTGYGGSGRTGDWQLAQSAVAAGHRVLLAGGLQPDNVAAAIAAVAPWGVDVASGVESAPGIKDTERMRAFVRAAKGIS